MKRLLLSCAIMATIVAQAQTITEYRYWMNDDVSTLTTSAAVPDVDLNLVVDLDLPSLSKDYHTITLQFKDSDVRYGAPYTVLFSRGTGAVNGYEWWIDDDIANRSSSTIGPDDVVDLIADLPTGVTNGDHLFTIRFSGASGTWSVPLTSSFSFFTGLEELPGVSDLLLFPNPVTGDLGLRLNSNTGRRLKLQVLDLDGAVVRDLGAWNVNGNAYRHSDIRGLASGAYLLRISSDQHVSSLRFIKQ